MLLVLRCLDLIFVQVIMGLVEAGVVVRRYRAETVRIEEAGGGIMTASHGLRNVGKGARYISTYKLLLRDLGSSKNGLQLALGRGLGELRAVDLYQIIIVMSHDECRRGRSLKASRCGSSLSLAITKHGHGLLYVSGERGAGNGGRRSLIECSIRELRLLVGGSVKLVNLLVVHVIVAVIIDRLKTGALAAGGGRLDSIGESLAGARGTGNRTASLGGADAVNGHLGGVLSLLGSLLLGLTQLLDGPKLPLNAVGRRLSEELLDLCISWLALWFSFTSERGMY